MAGTVCNNRSDGHMVCLQLLNKDLGLLKWDRLIGGTMTDKKRRRIWMHQEDWRSLVTSIGFLLATAAQISVYHIGRLGRIGEIENSIQYGYGRDC